MSTAQAQAQTPEVQAQAQDVPDSIPSDNDRPKTRPRPPPLEHFIYTVKKAQRKATPQHTSSSASTSPSLSSPHPNPHSKIRTRTDSAQVDLNAAGNAVANNQQSNTTTTVVQTLITEPETPSPILSAWPPSQPNPDYLAPYHPSLHKNLRNWSQGLLDQLRQKSESPSLDPSSSPSTLTNTPSIFQAAFVSSTLPGIVAAAPSAYKDISISAFPLPPSASPPRSAQPSSTSTAPMAATSTSLETSTSASTVPSVVTPPAPVAYAQDGDKIERHFLFQTHHRPLKGQTPQQQQQQKGESASTLSPRRKSNGSGKSPRKDKDAPSTRRSNRSSERFRRFILFFQRLLRSLRRRGRGPQENDRLAQQGIQAHRDDDTTGPFHTFTSSEPSASKLDYLQVDETNDTETDEDNGHEMGRRAFSEIREIGSSTSPVKEASNNHQHLKSKLKEVPKMMKIVDKFKNHTRQDKAQEDTKGLSQTKKTTPAAPKEAVVEAPLKSSSSSTEGSSKRGPRYHPKLLELYTVTDHVLGVGTFATVKEIKLKSTGQSFALKIILKRTIQGKGGMLDTEIAVLSKVRHQNCISLLEMFETEDAVYLVTDLAEGGELFDQLLQKGYYTEADAARLVHEILLGVEYLHSLDIVHRDLKPENLLFADRSENARLMITDFGLSKVLTGQNDVLMTACGTPGYVAPEVLEQIGHGKPVDLWSLGVIAYTLLCGYTPFWGEDQALLFENIISGEYQYEEAYWKDISGLAKSFIDSLLIRSAEKRPTAAQALNHPWFRAMLDQDLATPVSPTDSVNLMPSVKKNFNATNVFKKAVRAVGMLRKLQASESKSRPPGEALPLGESGAGPQSPATVVTFHDIVSAALLSKRMTSGQGPAKTDSGNSSGSGDGGGHERSDSDENLSEVSAILEGLAVKP
ncbi:MAG: kinase-like domain-containing protein [Podila humilis]|nr:MAG: kinase-like domain-containing protein [Podila humilis]